MPLLRGPDGFIVNVDDAHAGQLLAGGYTPVNLAQASQETASEPANETGGVLGAIGAAASSTLSGVTLGGSDWALKGLLDDKAFERLKNDRAAHSLISGGGQIVGALVPTIASGGALTPAGALGRFAAEGIEAGKVAGGATGLARQLAYAGGEGALQNAGIYLSDVALGDRKLTAEGLNGALGTGLLFGTAGIPVSRGIEAGTIAARRMFARYAEGGAQAASDAAAAWTEQAQRHLEGFDQAADLAKAKLAETQIAREAANLQRLRANAEMADARAFTPPQEFPGAPASGAAPEAAGRSGAGLSEPASSSPAAVPVEPPEVAAARALRDRAKTMGGEPITAEEIAALEAKIGKRAYSSKGAEQPAGASVPLMVTQRMKQQLADLGFTAEQVSNMTPKQAWEAIQAPPPRPAGAPNALEQLAQQPGVTTAGPATAVREYGARAVPITADEAELGARLGEYQAARRAFDELHAQVDPDLDAILRGVQPGEIQRPPVPVGEFGAPGARGVKGQDTLSRLAVGTGRDEVAAAAPADLTGAGGPRARRAQGTPARSIGEVAAERAPVPVEPATAVGKRPAAAPTTGRVEVNDIGGQRMRATMPDGSTVDLGTGGADKFLAEQMPPGFRPAKVETHRPFVVEHGLPAVAGDVAKLDENAIYIAKPSEIAKRDVWGDPLKDANRERVLQGWKDGEKLPPIDAYVTPEGRIYIDDGNHRLAAAAQDGDRPVAVRFKDGTGYRPHGEAANIGERVRASLFTPEHASVPVGFDIRAQSHQGERIFSENPRVRSGVPGFGDLGRETFRDNAYIVRPSELEGPKLRGIQSGEDMVADKRTTDIRAAWGKGERVPALEIDVDPKGHYFVADGNHRLLAAAVDGDRPMLARFRPVEAEVGNMDRIGDDLSRALKNREPSAAGAPGGQRAVSFSIDTNPTASGTTSKHVIEASVGGQKAGVIRLATGKDGNLYVNNIVVLPKFRRQGVGTELYHEAARIAGAEGRALTSGTSITDEAEALWHKLVKSGRAEELPGGGFRMRATAAGPAADDLLAALSGTKAALDKGESFTAVGRAPAAATRAEQLLRHPETADRFMSRAQAAEAAAGPAAGPTRPPVNLPERARIANRYRAAEPEGHPLDVKRLEMAHDDAVERAATAADPAERAAAAQEAKQIEQQMTSVGARPGAVEDVAAIAPALTRVERAAAALTEALGEAAPAAAKEHAAAFRAAEDEASRKTTARIGQAADDASAARAATANRDPLAPPPRASDDLLLGPSQKQQRIAAAQKAQREAGAAYTKARVAEAEAQIGAKQAAGAAAEARARLGPPPEAPGAARGQGVGGRAVHAAHMVGYAAELGSDLGIPGIPRPHDIPVIGPLLSAYLKYRALRAAAGRFVGRVPVTGEARAAELAARTRDGIARAVDLSLGLIERNTNTIRAALTIGTLKATDALSKRLVDDGAPDAPAKASVSEQAAVRMREVAAVVANPALIHDAIRVQSRALTDPDLIDALSNHLLNMFAHLNEVAPKGPAPNPFTGKAWTPPEAEAVRWGQQVAIAKDPQVAFQMLEAGTLTNAGAETMRRCYELLFRDGQARVIQRATDLKNPVEYEQLLRIGRLFDLPLHPSQDPQHAAALAAAHTPATKPAPAAAQASSPPTPSIANPTSISNLYDAGGGRRAGRT